MKQEGFLLGSILLLFLLISTMMVMNVYIVIETHGALEYHNSIFQGASLYDDSNYNKVKVNGVYFEPNYYCIWTKDRTEAQINRTDWHENCHDLVYLQHEHFCGETNINTTNKNT